MNRAARRDAKRKRKAFNKAMEKKQPSNDTYKEYHHAIVAFDDANANSICNARKFKVFTNSRGGQLQFVSTIEPHYENY